MKKITLILAFIALGTTIKAQNNIELTGTYGWSVNGSVNGYYGTVDMKDAATYGGNLSVEVKEFTWVEFTYNRSSTQFAGNYYNGFFSQFISGDMVMENYQIGVLRELKDGKVKPFTFFKLGGARYFGENTYNKTDFTNTSFDSWKFSANLGLGAKIFLSDRIGIRLQTSLLMPLTFDGVGIYVGAGSGGVSTGGGASFYVPILHWDLSGGLIFRISN
jgi:hypothetical protein